MRTDAELCQTPAARLETNRPRAGVRERRRRRRRRRPIDAPYRWGDLLFLQTRRFAVGRRCEPAGAQFGRAAFVCSPAERNRQTGASLGPLEGAAIFKGRKTNREEHHELGRENSLALEDVACERASVFQLAANSIVFLPL